MDSPIDFLATRTPPAPDELIAWLKIPAGVPDPDGGAVSVPRALVDAGLRHLEKTVASPGRDREAAHRLLAADALVTYGCEAAAEANDVRAALEELLGRVSTGAAFE